MRLNMLPTMSAALFFVSVLRKPRARSRMGTISANDGGSMAWTNDVDDSASSAFCVLSTGLVSAARSTGLRPAISGLRMTLPMSCSADLPAARTLMCVSENAASSCGTIWGRHWASWRGAQYAMLPSMTMEATLERQWNSSKPFSSDGMIIFTPWPVRLRMTARAAPCAASRTAVLPSPNAASRSGMMRMT